MTWLVMYHGYTSTQSAGDATRRIGGKLGHLLGLGWCRNGVLPQKCSASGGFYIFMLAPFLEEEEDVRCTHRAAHVVVRKSIRRPLHSQSAAEISAKVEAVTHQSSPHIITIITLPYNTSRRLVTRRVRSGLPESRVTIQGCYIWAWQPLRLRRLGGDALRDEAEHLVLATLQPGYSAGRV